MRYPKNSNQTQEQRTGKRDTTLDLGQVFLGRGTTIDARDLRTNFLQIFTVILLGEHHICVEEGEDHHHQEVQQLVDPGIGAKGRLCACGKICHPGNLGTDESNWK